MAVDVKQGPPVERLQEPVQETAPKRGRGRPRGSRTSSAAPSRRNLEQQIAATLMAMNMALYLIPPLQADALDTYEIAALAKALDAQAKSNARFRKMLEGALAITSGGQLAGVVMMIGMRRAARHGVIPADFDATLGTMIANGVTQNEASANGNSANATA